MNVEPFTVDTNILVYALDHRNAEKHKVARHVLNRLRHGSGVIALQALNELCNVASRKRPELRPAAEVYAIGALDALTVVVAKPEDLREALEAQQLHRLPFWDAILWATVRRSGCKVLLTEDFQDGRALGGTIFRNPFKMSAAELSAL